jgi:hypothetical protein
LSLILDGTNGVSDIDGTAATPAIRGVDGNTGVFFPGADTAAISTGGVERMRIDSAGRMTLPFQPAFSAYGGGSQSLSGAAAFQILQLGAQNTLGSRSTGYNTSTYTFTAPIAGTYAFSGKVTQTTDVTGPAINLYVNGAPVSSEVAIAYANSFMSASGFLIVQLAANDAVTLRVINYNGVSVTIDTTRSSFSGWLLG